MSAFVATPSWFGLALRFALRDLSGGVRGFGVLIACIAIGVAAITTVAAISRGLTDGIAREGRTILGADAAFVTIQREGTEAERRFFEARGRLAPVAYMRAMARTGEGAAALTEAKAVDPATWPQFGSAILAPDMPVGSALAPRDGVFGAAADPLLFTRLNVRVGDVILVGEARVQLRAELLSEPDKLAGGVGFGPRLLISEEALRATGLLQPGSLVRWSYRVTLPGEPSDAAVNALIAEARRAFPEAGWEIRSRMNASPQFARQIDRFTQFLTLVGLTALLVGGVGVANAAQGFVDRKRPDLATLKSLGAPGGFVFLTALIEVMLLAGLGALVGLMIGAAAPFVLVALFGHLLPLPLTPSIYTSELALGLIYGLLTALAFSIWQVGRTHDIPVSALFRDMVDRDGRRPRAIYMAATMIAAAALAALAVAFAWDRRIAMVYAAAAAGAFLLLRGVGWLVMAGARRLPHPRGAEARLALANIHRPGALTPSVTLSLGLGLTLLVALGLIDHNLRRALTATLPERAPSFFFIDIPSAEGERFAAFLSRVAGDGTIDRAPMMRGRIVAVKGVPAEEVRASENVAWVLEGDRGITYAAEVPANSRIVRGAWWPADHRGRPLVSMTRDIAEGLGLDIGDEITVNVLGRNLTAEVASIRQVEWRTVGINFIMVFSPNAFAGAPHTELATLSLAGADAAAREAAVARAVAAEWPAVSAVRVRDAMQAASDLVGQLTAAMRGASAVALLSSVFVLAGAMAAGRAQRIKDAVVLKTLGATRRQLLAAYLMEHGLLGLIAALFGIVAGALAAYGIVTQVMRLPFALDLQTVLLAVFAALAVTLIFGLAGTWRILEQKPAPYLREL